MARFFATFPTWMAGTALTAGAGVLLVLIWSDSAFAQATDLVGVTRKIGQNATSLPPLIAMISYAAGVFFAASGLLKLKDWINDGDKNPMMAGLIRLIVAALLVWLPHTIVITTGTFFKRADGSMDNKMDVERGRLSAFQKSSQQ